MSDSEDKINNKNNSKEKSQPHFQNPQIRKSDESNINGEAAQPLESVIRVKRPLQADSVTLIPNQLFGSQKPAQQTPYSGINILESMWRFKWTIILLTILVAVPSVIAIWTQTTPKYKARAEIRVRPTIPRLVYKTEDNGTIPLYTSFVNTQVSIIRSPLVLRRALDQQDVRDTQWFKKPSMSLKQKLLGNPIDSVERLRDELSVRPRTGTEIIDVSLITEKGSDAETIINAVLDQYIKYIGETSEREERDLNDELTKKIKYLDGQIVIQQGDLASLRKELGTDNPMALVSTKKIKLEETETKLNELQNNITLMEKNKELNVPDSNSLSLTKQRYSQDADWRQLDMNVKSIQHQIENSNYTDKHPKMIVLKSDLKFAEDLLKQRQQQLDEQWSDQNGNSLLAAADSNQVNSPDYMERQLAMAKNQKKILEADWDNQKTDFNDLFNKAQNYDEQIRDLNHTRDLYNDAQQRLDQKNMERNVPGSISINMYALASSEPYNDRRIVFSAMVLFLGLGIGGGAAYLRAFKSQTVYEVKDVFIPEGVPLLGYVPIVNLKKSIGKSLGREISENQFLLNESLRVIRTVLLSRLNGNKCTTLLISSATAGTGKSTFTMLLGRSLAKTGKKVLVIDADFKKMTISRLYESPPKRPGFTQALHEPLKYEQNLYHENNLDFMPTGNPKQDDSVPEEIANGAFKKLINMLSDHYDIILLDGSPILPIADSIILTGQVDGTIFVERENVSNRTNIMDAINRINSCNGNLVGSVYVGSKSQAGSYGYDYYYGKTT